MGASIRDIAKAIGAPDAAEKWQPRIDEWEALYAGNRDTIDLTYLSGGTKRTPRTLNLGKSVAEDWAGLIWGEGATITAGAEDSPETQWLRVLIDHDDLRHAFRQDLAGDLRHAQRAVDRLTTGHRHGVVEQDLVGDVHPGRDRGADREQLRMRRRIAVSPVSYTHLTLPTKRIV